MRDSTAFSTEPLAGWQLLAELEAAAIGADGPHLGQQVREVLSTLRLPELLLAPVQKALLQAALGLAPAGKRGDGAAPLRIRIWVAPGHVCGRGWGFFLVEKPGDEREGAAPKTGALVELFLYQEPQS